MIVIRSFENEQGVLTSHMIHPNNIEYTLCGLAFDCEIEYEGIKMVENSNSKINCKTCFTIIDGCKRLSKSKIEKIENLIIP